MTPHRAMILAAGYGKRLEPLTGVLPKPMLPVCNRPVIERTLLLLKRFGIDEVVINLHHRGQAIQDYLCDGSRLGMEITYSPEVELLGTAGGIKGAEAFLRQGTFLVINGDILMDLDIDDVARFHGEKGSVATLVLREEDASAYGVIKVDDEGRVVRFLHHSANTGTEQTVQAMFTGVQMLHPSLLGKIPPDKPWGTAQELYPLLLREGAPVHGYIMKGPWLDMGTPRRYLEANFMVLKGTFPFHDERDQWGGETVRAGRETWAAEGVKMAPPVLLGEGCRLEEGSVAGPNLVMGDDCRLGRNSRITNSVVWEGVEIGPDSVITDSIISSCVRLPPSSVLESKIVVRDDSGRQSVHDIGR